MPGAGRIRLLSGLFVLALLVLGVKLGNMQVVNGGYWQSLATDQHRFFARLIPFRGEIKITDQASPESYPVATNIQSPLVYVVPKDVQDKMAVARSLAPILGMGEQEIYDKINQPGRSYVPLKRKLTEGEREKVEALRLTGVQIDEETVRYYPEGQLLSNLVGFLGYKDGSTERTGVYGLERSYQDQLAGRPGHIRSFKEGGGAWLFGADQEFVPAQNGTQLILSVDRSIQLAVEETLKKTVEKHGADGGCIIVMNPKTGAIVAMASNPTFNANEYGKVTDPAVFANSCTTASYEPGSVFKAVTMAAALDQGAVGPDTVYTDPGQMEIDGYTIKNSDNKAHGVQTMTQVLEESLNTGVIFAKNKIGNQKFLEYVKRFGFGVPTGVDVQESAGNLNNLKGNIEVNYATASFGQGILVTPLQMTTAYAALANAGIMPRPYVVASKIDAEGKTEDTKPKYSERVVSPAAAASTAAMLVSVVEHGHGKRAAVPGYYVAGKTGTAQVAKKDGGGYDPDNNIGTFVGFAPVEDPKFVMLVRINHPRDVKFAESTAAPAFGELAQFILSYYNVPPTRPLQ
jgi:cell division protein FtsI/penicillin-binding protein 2